MTPEELKGFVENLKLPQAETKTDIDYDKLAASLMKAGLSKQEEAPKEQAETAIEGAKKAEKAVAEEKTKIGTVASAVKFLNDVQKVTTENEHMFGSTAKYLLSKLETLTANDDEISRANEYRKALIELYMEKQANLDCLPVESKSELLEYKGLSESARREKSAQFWKIINTGIAIANAQRKAELLKQGKSIVGTTDASARFDAFLRGNTKPKE